MCTLSICFLVDCSSSTLAYASYCMLDISDNSRPVAGYINICPLVRFYSGFVLQLIYSVSQLNIP